ncbi:MAG: hypothetical protein V2A34_13010 [Lentisphaerota bacterium]
MKHAWMLSLAVAALLAACRPRAEEGPWRAPPDERIGLLQPALTNQECMASFSLIKKRFPRAEIIAPDRGGDGLQSCLKQNKILIFPDASSIPVDLWTPLENYLGKGGAAVFFGLDPFALRVVRTPGGFAPEEEWLAALAEGSLEAEGFSSIQLWRHENGESKMGGAVRLAHDVDLPWPGVLLETKPLETWDALVLDALPATFAGAGENTLVFYAKGDARTSVLVIECEEEDGSRWVFKQSLGQNWKLCVVHEALFEYAFGGNPPDGTVSRLKLSRVKKVSAGLFNHHAPQLDGTHIVGLSNIRIVKDERATQDVTAWPDIRMLSPPWRYYSFSGRELVRLSTGKKENCTMMNLQSPLPRSRGLGGDGTAEDWRWCPMAEVLDANGSVRGWPVSVAIRTTSNSVLPRVAWVALPCTPRGYAMAMPLLEECLGRLADGLFLHHSGAGQYVFEEGERLAMSSRWCSADRSVKEARIMAELVTGDGHVLRRVVSPSSPPDTPVDLSLGSLQRVESKEDVLLRITLLDARVTSRRYDWVEQPVKLLSQRETPSETDWLGAQGPYFARRKIPCFLMGVNYWPVSVNGRMPGEKNPYWLSASEFDPALIRRDLDMLAEAGINTVSIQYHEESQAPQLRYFLDEVEKRNIRVHLFMPFLNPLNHDTARAESLIRALHLQDQNQVFAIDMAWEPRLGSEAERGALDGEWRKWLMEQYGGVEQAEQALGMPLWKKEGVVTGPPDASLMEDGPDRLAVVTYRRFVADYVSRQYGYLKRFLRSLGCRQLLGARTGYGGSGNPWADRFFPLDPAAGAAHLDFMSPEGWGLLGSRESFLSAGFITAYARGVSDAKPVAWVEYGSSVGMKPSSIDLENQARVYRNMLEMVEKSRAAACFAWWYPGGYRVEEKTDMGLVNPDGTLRPAGHVVEEFTHARRVATKELAAWNGREMDTEEDARGLSALREKWASSYIQDIEAGRMQEIRPKGFNQFTTEIPWMGPGGVVSTNPSPLAYANAEWGFARVNGVEQNRRPGDVLRAGLRDTLQLELINTGPAKWKASQEGIDHSAWFRAEQDGHDPQLLKLPQTPFGKNCVITWVPSDTGLWKVRPWLLKGGSFGELLEVQVLPGQEASN